MINGGHTFHPTIQDQEKYMATSKHMKHNPAKVITAVKHLSIFVKKVLYGIASELASRVQDKNHVLDIIYDLDNSNLYPESVLMSFDIIICSLVSITKWG